MLVRITQKGIKRVAHRDIGGPGIAAVSAIGIEELRIRVVSGIPAIEPDHVDAAVRRHGHGAKPMPFVGIGCIVIDPARGRESEAAIGALDEHDIARVEAVIGSNAGYHIDIVIRGPARAIYGKEQLSDQADRVDRLANVEIASHVDFGDLVEGGSDRRIFRVARPNAGEDSGSIHAAKKEVAAAIDIESSIGGRVRDIDRVHPGQTAIRGTGELAASVVAGSARPELILEAVSGAVGVIDGEPLLIPASGRSHQGPIPSAIVRTPHVVVEICDEAEIEKDPCIG